MGKLACLHDRAGNPDLSHWNDTNTFTVDEAAMLTAGIDPLGTKGHHWETAISGHINEKHALMICRAMRESICSGQMVAASVFVYRGQFHDYIESVSQNNLDPLEWKSISPEETIIARKPLLDWYKRHGYINSPNQRKAPAQSLQQETPPPPASKLMVLPRYTTPAIEVINEIVIEHWEGFDPQNPDAVAPKQEIIVEEIKYKLAEHGYPNPSHTMAEYMERIARHPLAKFGGNNKSKG